MHHNTRDLPLHVVVVRPIQEQDEHDREDRRSDDRAPDVETIVRVVQEIIRAESPNGQVGDNADNEDCDDKSAQILHCLYFIRINKKIFFFSWRRQKYYLFQDFIYFYLFEIEDGKILLK